MYTKLKTYNENVLVPRNIDKRKNTLVQKYIKLLSQEVIEGDLIVDIAMLEVPLEHIKVKEITGDLECIDCELDQLPVWFENLTVHGSFACYDNYLKNLIHSPKFVGKHFDCSTNYLESLKGCTKNIPGYLVVNYNSLTSLEYCPKIGGGLHCIENLLTSLEGLNKLNNELEDLDCSKNQLVTLKGCVETIYDYFDCSDNQLTSIEFGPKIVKGNYFCMNNASKLEYDKSKDVLFW